MSRKRVVRLMHDERLQARPRKRFKATTDSNHAQPVAPNVLAREFTAEAPNQCWVGDTTVAHRHQRQATCVPTTAASRL